MKKSLLSLAAVLAAFAAGALDAVPKVPKGATLALVQNCEEALKTPAYKAYCDYVNNLCANCEALKPVFELLERCGIDSFSGKWGEFVLGELVRPADDAETFSLPDVACVMANSRPITFAPIVEFWNEKVPEKIRKSCAEEFAFGEETIAGERLYTITSKRPTAPVDNFKICFGVFGGTTASPRRCCELLTPPTSRLTASQR